MSVQSVEIKDACRTWRAKDGNSYYVTLSHVCRDGRIGTGKGKPILRPSASVGISLGLHSNIVTVQYRNRTVRDIQYNSIECTVQTRKWAIAQALPHVLYYTTQSGARIKARTRV